MSTVEERLERIERVLEDSGIGLLAELRAGETLREGLGHLAAPDNLRRLSALNALIEEDEALLTLAESLKKLKESGLLALFAEVAAIISEGFSHLAEPKNLKVLSHLGNAAELLGRADPTAAGMMLELFTQELSRSRAKDPPRVGFLGLMRALSEPEVERALGFLLELLRALGRALEEAKKREEELKALMAKAGR